MKVFISWSGETSHAVAMLLRDELPIIINAIKPFVSSEDISKGTPWFQNVATELEDSVFGIVCLTKKNIHNKWILFEAGALAGKLSKKRIAPLLVDLSPEEVEPPLGQLQLTSLGKKDDFFKLISTLNSELGERALAEATLKKSFEMWWEVFNKSLKEKLATVSTTASKTVDRTEKEILNEVLSLTRSIASNLPQQDAGISAMYPGALYPGAVYPGIQPIIREQSPAYRVKTSEPKTTLKELLKRLNEMNDDDPENGQKK